MKKKLLVYFSLHLKRIAHPGGLFCEQNGRRFVYPLLTEYVIL